MATTDPFAVLKEDHRKVASLFAEIEPTTERAEKTRRELFHEIKRALDEHATLEETILYPALQNQEETKSMAQEAEEEHRIMRTLIAEMEAIDETSEEWSAKMNVLIENVTEHVDEEESQLFPDAEKAMSEEDLAALGENLRTAKAESQSSMLI